MMSKPHPLRQWKITDSEHMSQFPFISQIFLNMDWDFLLALRN